MSQLEARLKQLSPQQRKLLLQRLKQNKPSTAVGTIPVIARDRTHYRLSDAQRRLWFLDQFSADASAAYHMAAALHLRGVLDNALLQASLNLLVQRHTTLRLYTITVDDEPHQAIGSQITVPIKVVATTAAELKTQLDEVIARPFDLSQPPLLRVQLFQLAANEHVLLFVIHHILFDGLSTQTFLAELAACYAALSQGQEPQMPPLAVDYIDYAEWQQAREDSAEMLAYWQQQLAGDLPILALPTDHPRPQLQTYSGARHDLPLSAELLAQLNQLARQHNATLFMLLLAAYGVLLHRYSGQSDLIIGTPVNERQTAELQNVLGFFANTLSLRLALSAETGFADLLQQCQQTVADAYAHQQIPFEKILAALQPDRSLAHPPIFQTMLILRQAVTPPRLGSVETAFYPLDLPTAKFDLTLLVTESADSHAPGTITFEYNTDLFDPATITRMAGHFRTLLTAFVQHPQQSITASPLLTMVERQQIASFNATAAPYDSAATIHSLFEAQVSRTPGMVAIEDVAEQLTYADLNARANQLADYLRSQGVMRGDIVGLMLERSCNAMVGLLGILKADAAYLPLDPAYPSERRNFMLNDAGVKVIVTQQSLADELQDCAARPIFLDADDAAALALCSAENPSPRHRNAEQLIYVIYTSGSTGQPKGVALPHRTLTNLLTWQWRQSERHTGIRTAQFTTLSFDVSAQELFAVLCSGGTLVVVNNETRQNSAQMADYLVERNIARLFLPFVALQQLAEQFATSTQLPPALVEVITCGEQLQATAAIRDLFARLPQATLWNHYGPTETHVVTSYQLAPNSAEWVPLPAIGTPVSNSTIYILDDHLNPLPIGLPGELYIGGIALAHGYLKRPRRTATSFIPDPFAASAGARMYRTGDIARFLPTGDIEFLGRADFQVKLRGYRIELGEVETALANHPAVQQAVVTADKAHERLIAYLLLSDAAVTVDSLRAWLATSLPDYMLPTAWMIVDHFTQTPNGKVNRLALPAYVGEGDSAETPYAPPATVNQLAQTSIWQEVLGIDRIGIDDNFFALGGHSLLATRVVARLRHVTGKTLPLSELFATPTIRQLSTRLSSLPHSDLPPLTAGAAANPAPLSFAQQRLWFLHHLNPHDAGYNITQTFRFSGALNTELLAQSVSALVAYHASLRTRIELIDDVPMQCIDAALAPSLQQHNLSDQADQVSAFVQQQASCPFDLTQDALARFTLLQLAAHEHVFCMTLHHIIADGWSLAVLMRDLSQFYNEGALPTPSPVSYADYAQWQRNWLAADALAQQTAYWQQQLTDATPVLALPNDFRPNQPRSYRGNHHFIDLPPLVQQQFQTLCQQQGATLFMGLLAAFKLLLARYSGHDDIVVGTPVANRHDPAVEPIVGMFINTLALRSQVAAEATFIDLLQTVRQTTLDGFANQHVPFEHVVDVVQPQRQLGVNPIFQVMFVMQNNENSTPQLADVSSERLALATGAATFDLTLVAWETDAGFAAAFEYSCDHFSAETMTRLSRHLATLLTAAVATPSAPVAHLALLNLPDQHTLTHTWATRQTKAAPQCIHHIIAAQVRRTPAAPALIWQGETLSYAEMDQRANQLAHHLQAQGVGLESFVGIAVDRSAAMVIGLLAILKAGGAYVPPRSRLPAGTH